MFSLVTDKPFVCVVGQMEMYSMPRTEVDDFRKRMAQFAVVHCPHKHVSAHYCLLTVLVWV